MKLFTFFLLLFLLFGRITFGQTGIVVSQLHIPVLVGKDTNPVLQLNPEKILTGLSLEEIKIKLKGTGLNDVESLSVYHSSNSKEFRTDKQFGSTLSPQSELTFFDHFVIPEKGFFWLSVKLKDKVNLLHQLAVTDISIQTSPKSGVLVMREPLTPLRFGVALRQHNDDGVHTYRIPGLTTTSKGTLLAVYDARRESSRDLQGDIDIGLSRSIDGGETWEPMRMAMDRGTWGGLPQKFNGISDPCILADPKSGKIYLAALWMHGVLDKDGKWIEGLTESSAAWNHQWREKGSQPGFGVKETTQFLLAESSDDGVTWSEPINLTEQCKQKDWWLFAPAPGHGIVLDNGTLVFPAQGRSNTGEPFSTIMWSADGKAWKVGNPASTNTTENMATQLSDGSVMLNIRDNRNRQDTSATNGRAVRITRDLGQTWTVHPTDHSALIEPVCMGSIHKHIYTEKGIQKSLLLFVNPESKTKREKITLKVSFDDGKTWPKTHRILLDELSGRGYSCITSIGENAIGIVYESSQADLVFQKISLDELLK